MRALSDEEVSQPAPNTHRETGAKVKGRLKCDRKQPCDSCVRREKTCHYASNATRGPPKQGPNKTREFVDRLDTLESLVSSFISKEKTSQIQESKPKGVSASPSNALTPDTPRLQTAENGQVNYIDPSHWRAILEDIREVRDHLSPSKSTPSNPFENSAAQTRESDASFVFGSRTNINLDDILSALPSQPICGMMLSWYFEMQYMVLGEL